MTPDAWSAIITNIVTASAAVAASGAAIYSLKTWRHQEIWKQDNDLARRIMVLLGKFEQALRLFRYPVTMLNIGMNYENEFGGVDDEKTLELWNKYYQQKWDKLITERNELDVLLLEAKAVWGEEVEGVFNNLNALWRDFEICVHEHHREIKGVNGPSPDDPRFDDTGLINIEILLDNSKNDPLRVNLRKEMKLIERYLQLKMGRRK